MRVGESNAPVAGSSSAPPSVSKQIDDALKRGSIDFLVSARRDVTPTVTFKLGDENYRVHLRNGSLQIESDSLDWTPLTHKQVKELERAVAAYVAPKPWGLERKVGEAVLGSIKQQLSGKAPRELALRLTGDSLSPSERQKIWKTLLAMPAKALQDGLDSETEGTRSTANDILRTAMFEQRGATHQEAQQQILLMRAYGLNTYVEQNGTLGAWPKSASVPVIDKALAENPELSTRVVAYLTKLRAQLGAPPSK